jgi:hypothetical protein
MLGSIGLLRLMQLHAKECIPFCTQIIVRFIDSSHGDDSNWVPSKFEERLQPFGGQKHTHKLKREDKPLSEIWGTIPWSWVSPLFALRGTKNHTKP